MNWQHTIANIAIRIQMKMLSKDVYILVIYRPPLSSTNSSMNYFMEEFSSLLEQYDVKSGSLPIAGDFNLHIDKIRDVSTANFINLLEAFLLPQHRCGIPYPKLSKIQHQLTFLNAVSKNIFL